MNGNKFAHRCRRSNSARAGTFRRSFPKEIDQTSYILESADVSKMGTALEDEEEKHKKGNNLITNLLKMFFRLRSSF